MTVTAKALIDAKFAASSDTTEYTVSANTRVIIDKFTATNTDGSSQTITVNLVKTGTSVASSNLVVSVKSIATNVTSDLSELQNQILNAGDFVSVKASIASKVVIRMSGREVT